MKNHHIQNQSAKVHSQNNVVRVKHDSENPFLMVNKKSINDHALSLEAIGLLVRLLCNKDDWIIHVSQLIKVNNCGKDKMYRILRELVSAGYAYLHQERQKGKYKCGTWYIFETPKSSDEIKKMLPQPENPDTVKFTESEPYPEKPDAVKPDTANPPLMSINNTMSIKKEKIYIGTSASPPSMSVSSLSNKKDKESKNISYGEHVKLKEGDYEKLCEKIGKEYLDHWIEELDDHIGSKGAKYVDHAKTIQIWHKRALNEGKLPNLLFHRKNQMGAFKDRILTNKAICNHVEEKLRSKFSSTNCFEAGPLRAFLFNERKDIHKHYIYEQIEPNELISMLEKDLPTCFYGCENVLEKIFKNKALKKAS